MTASVKPGLLLCDSMGRCYDQDDIDLIMQEIKSREGQPKPKPHVWRPISELPEGYQTSRKMFIVRGTIDVGVSRPKMYTTDAYAVWYGGRRDGVDVWAHWPHHQYQPTHFCELPEEVKE